MPPSAQYRNGLDWLMQVTYTTWRLFKRNGLQNHAAATAFYFLLSATPLLLLLTYAAHWLAGLAADSVIATILVSALYEQFSLDSLASMGFIPRQTELAAGSAGLIALLLSSRGLLNAIHGAMQVIFTDDSRRRMVVSWTLPLIIIPIAFLLVGLAIALQATLSFLAQTEFLGGVEASMLKSLNFLVAILTIWALVFAAYWRLPVKHPPARLSGLIALLSTLTLMLLFYGFGLFFEPGKYKGVYGALGGVVFVLIGAYFACVTFYLWAQGLYALSKVDVAALEKLFLSTARVEGNRVEGYIFARADRLLAKYGRNYAEGEILIQEGDNSQTAFFLHTGQVALYKEAAGERHRLGSLGEGELFGEMAYLLGEPRTATVVAQGDVVVLALPPETLEELMRYSAPLSRRIIGTLCQRLMRMNLATRSAPPA